MAGFNNVKKTSFKDVFSNGDEERFKYLGEYLDYAATSDPYISGIFRKMIGGIALTEAERSRVDDLMKSVALDALYVDSLLDDEFGDKAIKEVGGSSDGLGVLIKEIEVKGKGVLSGWDEKFVFGENGNGGLWNQYKVRKWLSDKQRSQVKRIGMMLKLKDAVQEAKL